MTISAAWLLLPYHYIGRSHRINTSEFKHVKYLSNKRVLQVVCGQQHTICRATDSDPNRSHKISSDGILGDLFLFTILK